MSFYNILGFYPRNIEYYQQAVKHKSLVPNSSNCSNERLEFLGDAVLSSIISDILYKKYTNQQEGFLTNLRSKIVNRDSLNQLAAEIGLDKLVLAATNTHTSSNIYGNALEALIGAIYLDYGYRKCKDFVENHLLNSYLDLEKVVKKEDNYKSKLIEWCQKYHFQIEFELLDEVISDKNMHRFTTSLKIEGIEICKASGLNKKESQQSASQMAYQKIKKDPSLIQNLLNETSKSCKIV